MTEQRGRFPALALVLSALMGVSGCAIGGFDRSGPPPSRFPVADRAAPLPQKQVQDLVSDPLTAQRLGEADLGRLEEATVQALEAPLDEGRVNWVGLGGSAGTVEAGPILIDGVESPAGRPYTGPLTLDTGTALLPKSQPFRTTTNVNVRLGPGLDHDKVDRIDAGNTVTAVGATQAGDWYLTAQDGRVIGYMFAELLAEAGPSETLLAGARPRYPRVCRLFRQSVTFSDGERTTWRGVACRTAPDQWGVDPALSG